MDHEAVARRAGQEAGVAGDGRQDACTATEGGRDARAPEEEKLPAKVDRRRVLDETRRRQIVALVAGGSSLRTAARFVGCATSTITRALRRDHGFDAEVTRAEHALEVEMLRNLRRAARKGKYWRAAAWLLERSNPDAFAKRPPRLYNPNEVADAAAHCLMYIPALVPPEHVEAATKRLSAILDFFDREGVMPDRRELPESEEAEHDVSDNPAWWDYFDAALDRLREDSPWPALKPQPEDCNERFANDPDELSGEERAEFEREEARRDEP